MKNRELLRMLLAGFIRHALTALSTYLVANRMVTAEPSADVINVVTNYAVDILPALVALIWSSVQKSDTHEEIVQAATVVAATPVVLVTPAVPEPKQ
jgi:hypothetical protein